jgi:hypothetical protein
VLGGDVSVSVAAVPIHFDAIFVCPPAHATLIIALVNGNIGAEYERVSH